MTTAPETSLRPLARHAGDLMRDLADTFGRFSSADPRHLPSAQALELLALVLIIWWLSRRAAAAGAGLHGRWRMRRPAGGAGAARPCAWHVGSTRMASGMQKWRCETCGKDGFSGTDGPPPGCGWLGGRG